MGAHCLNRHRINLNRTEMNPKEKAESLLKSMIPHAACETGEQNWLSAKQCAIIAVDEILAIMDKVSDIESNYFDSIFTGNVTDAWDEFKRWQEVKTELEKM